MTKPTLTIEQHRELAARLRDVDATLQAVRRQVFDHHRISSHVIAAANRTCQQLLRLRMDLENELHTLDAGAWRGVYFDNPPPEQRAA